MANEKDIEFECRPLYVLDERLRYHSMPGSGRLLDGALYDREWLVRNIGREDLPFVQIGSSRISDDVFPGGFRPEVGNPLRADGRLVVYVGARREFGMVTRDPSGDDAGRGVSVSNWAARVKAAMVTKANGAGDPDVLLEGTLSQPLSVAQTQLGTTDLAAVITLEVSWLSMPFCASERAAVGA